MRVFVDSNIIFSAIAFPSSEAHKTIEKIFEHGTLVLCTFSINELKKVFERKLPQKLRAFENFLVSAPFELIYTPSNFDNIPPIRDEKDKPILSSVILAQPDYFITGDHDFLTTEIKDLINVITIREFLEIIKDFA
jgi:putative PIN family toxin of toxin-antitoxin system